MEFATVVHYYGIATVMHHCGRGLVLQLYVSLLLQKDPLHHCHRRWGRLGCLYGSTSERHEQGRPEPDIYISYMTVYFVISLPKIPDIHRIHKVDQSCTYSPYMAVYLVISPPNYHTYIVYTVRSRSLRDQTFKKLIKITILVREGVWGLIFEFEGTSGGPYKE